MYYSEGLPVATRPLAQSPAPPVWDVSPRIAVYQEAGVPPTVIALIISADRMDTREDDNEGGPGYEELRTAELLGTDGSLPPGGVLTADGSIALGATAESVQQVIEDLTTRAHGLSREQGGGIPVAVFKELIENLVHASFSGVVINILDGGNTLRISDQGPGIPDKDAALRPGFTSADAQAKRYIRGVGSGFSVVQRALATLGGALEIEDNLGRGTVITARIPAPIESPLASAPTPAYNLPERQLKVLLLTVELAPVGPTRIAQELGISTSTAYRDLVSLEQAGFVVCRPSGHRSATDTGLAYVGAVV